MLEMETLSPLIELGQDESIEHLERWELFDQVPGPPDSEDEIEKVLTGKVSKLI